MAYTPSVEFVKIVNISIVNFNGLLTVSGDNILDGMTFEDQQDKVIKVASGNEIVVSEKTMVTLEAVGMTDAEVATLKGFNNTVLDYILITLDNSDTINLVDCIPSVLKAYKAGDVNRVKISIDQSTYNVDTISEYS